MQNLRYTDTLSRKLGEIKQILGKREAIRKENEKSKEEKYADFQVKECTASGDCEKAKLDFNR
ncbi:hypothetical protein [Hominifimenecus sp. rT4P-3]|uniref:hypothetical protein n=1 Tax=Hominifimenecus sp. rT4P-3 TaxID=3242979 RepID=UPI003DA33E28